MLTIVILTVVLLGLRRLLHRALLNGTPAKRTTSQTRSVLGSQPKEEDEQ